MEKSMLLPTGKWLATFLGAALFAGLVGLATAGNTEPPTEPAGPPRALMRWTNKDARSIEASFEGLDGPNHVLLRTAAGLLYRYPILDLSWRSRELAHNDGKPRLLQWTNLVGNAINASFEDLDGPDHVLLRPSTGVIYRYPMANLSPESRQQAKNLGNPPKLSVLCIGDSMSFGGFGKRMDQRFRATPGVGAVHTYMACGTNPLSWLNVKPYATVSTHCGYWSIESEEGAEKPREVMDMYEMTKGHRPEPHPVPKMENLLATCQPQVLVVQCGNNFFSAFTDGKTIREHYHADMIRVHMGPFMSLISSPSSPLRKVYWVTPPQAGNATEEVQDFVYEQIRRNAGPWAMVIDSRKLTHYPYRHMEADKEHFWGQEAQDWADAVFNIVEHDLSSQPVYSLPKLHEREDTLAKAKETIPAAPSLSKALRVRAKLVFKTPPLEPEKIAPYQELMVGYVYQIEKILEGSYADGKILVMHPAYIRLKKQDVEQREVGGSYDLHVQRLDSASLWNTIRRVDASDSFDLDPYLISEDEERYPDAHVESAQLSLPDPCASCP